MPKKFVRQKTSLPSNSTFVRHWDDAYSFPGSPLVPHKAYQKVEDDTLALLRADRFSSKRLEILLQRVAPHSAQWLRGVIERTASEPKMAEADDRPAASARIYGIPLSGRVEDIEAAMAAPRAAETLQSMLKGSGYSHASVTDVVLPVVLSPADIHDLSPSALYAVSQALFRAAKAPTQEEREKAMRKATEIAESWTGTTSRRLDIARDATPHLPQIRFVLAAHVADVLGNDVSLPADGFCGLLQAEAPEELHVARERWRDFALDFAGVADVFPFMPVNWNALRLSLAEYYVDIAISDLVRFSKRTDIAVEDVRLGIDVVDGVLLLHVLAKGSYVGMVPVPEEYMQEEDALQFMENLTAKFPPPDIQSDEAREAEAQAYTDRVEAYREGLTEAF